MTGGFGVKNNSDVFAGRPHNNSIVGSQFRNSSRCFHLQNTALQLAKAIAENRGIVNNEVKDAFFNVGYSEAALIELAALVALRTFTNYVYALTRIPIDFPMAEKI